MEEYYAPLVGQWSALRDEADRWRKAAKTAGDVTDTLTKSLGGLDASWQGREPIRSWRTCSPTACPGMTSPTR